MRPGWIILPAGLVLCLLLTGNRAQGQTEPEEGSDKTEFPFLELLEPSQQKKFLKPASPGKRVIPPKEIKRPPISSKPSKEKKQTVPPESKILPAVESPMDLVPEATRERNETASISESVIHPFPLELPPGTLKPRPSVLAQPVSPPASPAPKETSATSEQLPQEPPENKLLSRDDPKNVPAPDAVAAPAKTPEQPVVISKNTNDSIKPGGEITVPPPETKDVTFATPSLSRISPTKHLKKRSPLPETAAAKPIESKTAPPAQTAPLPNSANSGRGEMAETAVNSSIKFERSELEELLHSDTPPTLRGEQELKVLLKTDLPIPEKKKLLLELARTLEESGKELKAQQIYSFYLQKFPEDEMVPNVLLQQGLVYRKIGANTQALSKFYAVMTSAITLKGERLDFYRQLVSQAQAEIAETYYLQGRFAESCDFYSRLLKLPCAEPEKRIYNYKLIRSLFYQNQHSEVIARSKPFLESYSEMSESAEIRFLYADSLKKTGRTQESLEQVLLLLKSQQATAQTNPQNWIYWQRRTGNEIANQLYKEGDFVSALEIYSNLVPLDPSPQWQLPVQYQMGLIYERLEQPKKALEVYDLLLSREKEVATLQGTSSLKSLLEMARWRKDNLKWQAKAVDQTVKLASPERSPRP